MNWIDLLIVILMFFFALGGLGRSLILETLDLVSLLIAFFFSLKFYNFASLQLEQFFSLPHSLANVLGFVAVWFLVEALFYLLARFFLYRLLQKLEIPGETYISVIPAFFKGLIFLAIFLVLTNALPIQPFVKETVQNSKLASLILTKTYQLEAPLKNIFGEFVNDTLAFLTIKPGSDERVNLGFRATDISFNTEKETAMIVMVNQERTSRGLRALTGDEKLIRVGRAHSQDMFAKGYFSHYSLENKDVADRAQKEGVNFLIIGENLAFAPSLELAHEGLMKSPGHRANILSSDYRKMGIGVAESDYGLMITQVFTN